jgi:hypothetical protein
MKCFQCDQPAIGLCRWCQLGQCEEHLRAGLEARRRTPTMGCIHPVTAERNVPRESARGGLH